MKLLLALVFTFFLMACNTTKSAYSIDICVKNKKIHCGDTILISVKNQKMLLENPFLKINGNKLIETEKGYIISTEKLGEHFIELLVDNQVVAREKVIIYASFPPKLYTYRIINQYPHDISYYTQGFEFQGDTLYESTGLKGKSLIVKMNPFSRKIYQKKSLESRYFGEGITVLNDKLYQLTWQEGIGFVYNTKDLNKIKEFVYRKSKEGWGLCNDTKRIYKSDGSKYIWILNPETLVEEEKLTICSDQSTFSQANELEYVEGIIYMNMYAKDEIMMIDAQSGAVVGAVNMKGIKEKLTQHAEIDVLNGIAYHQKRKTFFITGKNWDKIFEVVFEIKNNWR